MTEEPCADFPHSDVDIEKVKELAKENEIRAKRLKLQRSAIQDLMPNTKKQFQSIFSKVVNDINENLESSYKLNYQPAEDIARLYFLNGSLSYDFGGDFLVLRRKQSLQSADDTSIFYARTPEVNSSSANELMWGQDGSNELITSRQLVLRSLFWLLDSKNLTD